MLETYLVSFGRRGKADLRGGGEIFENLAPGRILGGAAAVALVNDDQVEEARREFPEELLALLRPGDGLVKPQIYLIGGVDAALFIERGRKFDFGTVLPLDGLRSGAQLGHRSAEGPEIVHHRLIDEDVAVSKEEDAFLAARLPQPPDNLECRVGLAGASGHDQQHAILPFGDGFYRGIDGIGLVITRSLAAAVIEVILEDDFFFVRRDAFPLAVFRPELLGAWELVEREGGFLLRR